MELPSLTKTQLIKAIVKVTNTDFKFIRKYRYAVLEMFTVSLEPWNVNLQKPPQSITGNRDFWKSHFPENTISLCPWLYKSCDGQFYVSAGLGHGVLG